MPLLFFLIVVALLICVSSYRWKRTPEQRKAALQSLQRDLGGELDDYLDGAVLLFELHGFPTTLRLYALPKEPLAVSTEILLDLPVETSPQLASMDFEFVADKLAPSLRHAFGGRLEKYSFASLFRSVGLALPLENSPLADSLMKLWRLGPPRHVRFCVRKGKMMLSKDLDLCEPGKLRTFVVLAGSLLNELLQIEGASHGNAAE